ncbi:MAG: TonB-dependent receptor [Bacteroidia bacterium]|nr:TonB-dependent receptor [Bacteroidia bacterium]
MLKYVHALICTCTFFFTIDAQVSPDVNVSLEKDKYRFEDLISLIEENSDYTFSYNVSIVQSIDSLEIGPGIISLREALDYINSNLNLEYEVQAEFNKIILTEKLESRFSGNVFDAVSGESLQDVLIYSKQGILGNTNSEGYYSIFVKNFIDTIYFNYLGYKQETRSRSDILLNGSLIPLTSRNILDNVVITDRDQTFENIYPEKKIDREDLSNSQNISGNDDVFAYIRKLPGVSVGSEGQNGLNVRGGGPDQNLILMDGLPIYEASHLGGMSSVFISDAIKNIDFYKSAFPARFGGKLASILDVRLKDGHRNEFKRSVSMGIEGIEGHIEGPIGESTTINLNGKYSWFSILASPLIESNLDFNTSELNYSDGYVKLSHWFSPSNRISVSVYSGNDLIRLVRDENPDQQNFSFNDVNRIEWGNRLVSGHWNLALNKRLFLNSSLGISSYNYSSRGAYQINYVENDTLKTNSFDILSKSDLRDIILQSRLDFYSEKIGKFSFGFVSTLHKNAPSIRESEIFLDPELIPSTGLDSIYNSQEHALYIENERYFKNGWKLETGLRLNYFGGLDNDYIYLQPRLGLKHEKENILFSSSYARMSQHIHLLVNPGPGLPSDLWVPSTSSIAPEIADVFDLGLQFSKSNFVFGSTIFYNQYSNVIEYSNDSDILYSLIIDNKLFNVSVDNTNWEDRVSIGKGWSYGIVFSFGFVTDKLRW